MQRDPGSLLSWTITATALGFAAAAATYAVLISGAPAAN
jgi:hypothetical protein